jgi:hypothetical protein
MWHLPENSSYSDYLYAGRWRIVGSCINGAIMLAVLINTYRNSKLAYLYTVATMFFLSPLFQITAEILYNWYTWCLFEPSLNSQCPENFDNTWFFNLKLISEICEDNTYTFYHIGHWLFAFRYFEVAEMFGREDKTL